MLAHSDEHEQALANVEALHETGRNVADESIRVELSNMVDLRLVGISANEDVGPLNNVFAGLLPRGKVTYAQLGLLPSGQRLVQTTGADEIDASQRERWLEELLERAPAIEREHRSPPHSAAAACRFDSPAPRRPAASGSCPRRPRSARGP